MFVFSVKKAVYDFILFAVLIHPRVCAGAMQHISACNVYMRDFFVKTKQKIYLSNIDIAEIYCDYTTFLHYQYLRNYVLKIETT